MNYIYKADQLPKLQHFAALVFGTIHIPGDERSRTHPGHGYPAQDRRIVDYVAFDGESQMLDWVRQQEAKTAMLKPQYRIIMARPCEIIVKTEVTVS